MRPARRGLIAAAMAALGLCFGASDGHAYGRERWCAVTNHGGNVVWDCNYRTIEECVPNVISGNRGFCNTNPAWGEPRRYRRDYWRW
jgi:Protein of unknown function (DUF3551)